MKRMNLIFRRTHLYLGMFLVPWIFVYAFSTFMLNHGPTFRELRPPSDAWIQLWEKNYQASIPDSQEALRSWAEELLNDEGISTAQWGVNRNPQRVLITSQRFLKPVRVTYRFSDQMLMAEQREGSFFEAVLRLHFRHGYGQGDTMQWIWGFIVDVVCIAFLIWIITGLYLWWKISHTRNWGWVAIGAGTLTFLGLVIAL
jgi:hypothetical protein